MFFTQKLQEQELDKIVGAMKEQSFEEGEKIIKYGDYGKEYFVLIKGKVKVIIY